MNLIYACVFLQESYINLLKLLIKSIAIRSNFNKQNTDILIVTSESFKPIIQKELSIFDLPIYYYILNVNTLFEAGCARLNIFNYENINKYDKILYLDTDILINNNINILLDHDISNDKIYALEEGTIKHQYWGGLLFDFSKYNNNQSAFTTAILFFKNSESMRSLFDKINIHIKNYKFNQIPACLEQGFVVYNAITENKFDNQLLNLYAENNPIHINNNKIIYHFGGGPGVYKSKFDKMTLFFKIIESYIMSNNISIVSKNEDIWTISNKMRTDIAEFFNYSTNYKIAEIGSHKGYTTKFLSSIFSKVYAIDNNVEWTYLNKNFNKDKSNIQYIILDIYKDTWDVLPDDIEVSFIDAIHSYELCKNDILNSIKRFSKLKYIIFDDYGVWPGVKKAVDEMIQTKKLHFVKFIGTTDVPSPNGIVKNTNEGIICSINKFSIENCSYSWQNSNIKFLENGKMDAFGKGTYKQIETYKFYANFGMRNHLIIFNNDYSQFKSTRLDDSETNFGNLIN